MAYKTVRFLWSRVLYVVYATYDGEKDVYRPSVSTQSPYEFVRIVDKSRESAAAAVAVCVCTQKYCCFAVKRVVNTRRPRECVRVGLMR